ncbi:RNA-dependent RNA polymerase [Hubei odonate virus 9]|uniref:RNA-directed RNA polymerase L n=1 Tax=Hubei odonate virus 9 TaxID=1923004 RepID=A0A1L3KPL6_9VIRU|nr:RNA-dependent RNA polymerase [Hubei odonate virus 9]APG79275.1 RNA-dependent RNA polymerase [Hubei odonate virus 9]
MSHTRAFEYRGRADRIRRRGANDGRINPSSELEHSIDKTKHDLINAVDLSNSELLELYTQARVDRHEVWIEFLTRSRSDIGYQFGDIKFGDFLTNVLGFRGAVPDEIKNKTPDILFRHKYTGIVYLGDVAVSASVNLVYQRKYLKYKELVDFLKKNKYAVRDCNFIVNENLDNTTELINLMLNIGVINYNPDLVSRVRYFGAMAHSNMLACFNRSPDQMQLKQLIDHRDKTEQADAIDIPVPAELAIDMTPLPTKHTEMELINMIKAKVDQIDPETYFDNGIEVTIKEFDKLEKTYDRDDITDPKSVLKVCDNQLSVESLTNHDLILDYISDIIFSENKEVSDYVRFLLPTRSQLECMKALYHTRDKTVEGHLLESSKERSVYGPFQYKMMKADKNKLIDDTVVNLAKGKKTRPNSKEAPKTVHLDCFDQCVVNIEKMINYYGSPSLKPTFLNDDWDSSTNFELENSLVERENYDYCRHTCGAQLAHSLSGLYQRLTHLKISQGKYDNVYIPPNGSFICVIPKEHAPVNSKRCDVPLVFISRSKNGADHSLFNEYEHKVVTDTYTYYVSKLCRMGLDKIANWDQAGYRLVASSSHILSSCPELIGSKNRVVGVLTLLMLDCHQKPSEYLDLLKYVSYMPFSDISRLSMLIKDKFNILIKTSLDVWLLRTMKKFMVCLADTLSLDAKKPKLMLFNHQMVKESQGISMKLPSFINMSVRHKSVGPYIEEMGMLFIVRGKHLYGSQFLDQSTTSTAQWNVDYINECDRYGNWCTNGQGEGDYPFESNFSYSSDAIYYATLYGMKNYKGTANDVLRNLSKTQYSSYMHYNCSLRGCTKEPEDRANSNDYHSTSMDECLTYYDRKNYDETQCTTIAVGLNHLLSHRIQQYSMSEKDQRGSGRPIATPTLGTKAALCLVEKPEHAIGVKASNNILVAGKQKMKEMSEAYKSLVSSAAVENYKQVYQLTEDQSKWSENDNTRKYENYIKVNPLLDTNIRMIQLNVVRNIVNREHLVHRIPKQIANNPELLKYVNKDGNGVKAIIGWPQGMLNNLSTSIHSNADYWITYAYNIAYPNNKVKTQGLVHSDDSWVTVACNSIHDFKKFTLFRIFAKKMFCMKVNEKKLWGSRYLGELVSNYNINGTVHLSISKLLANAFNNLLYINWPIDVNTQISSIQQALRNGANQPTLILMATILKQQLLGSYQVRGKHKELLHMLPIELGGYPSCSAFELAVNGTATHYQNLLGMLKTNPQCEASIIIGKALTLSIIRRVDDNEIINPELISSLQDHLKMAEDEQTDWYYEKIHMPSRGEVFGCISHLLPMTSKLTRTITKLRNLPFETDGLEDVIYRPKELSTALGHLKSTTSSRIYSLAAEHYSNNVRRLAMCQSLQSSGKVVKIYGCQPMTYEGAIRYILTSDYTICNYEVAECAMIDESMMSQLSSLIVNFGTYTPSGHDKRKIINKLPETENRYKTISRLRNVLLFMLDSVRGTNFLTKYGVSVEPSDVLLNDSSILKSRFSTYFKYYRIEKAISLIMTQSTELIKSRLWMQPYLKSDNIKTFLEDLYGKTVNSTTNFMVGSTTSEIYKNKEADMVDSLYSMILLNKLYPNKFVVRSIGNVPIADAINNIDYAKLSGDHMFKYSILKKHHFDDDTFLREYDRSKDYCQNYMVRQTFEKGVYSGVFKVRIKYGGTTMDIHHDGEYTEIKADNTNIYNITNAMMQFVSRNFKEMSYSHPHQWSSCPVFKPNPIKWGKSFLTSYRGLSTVISTTAQHDSIPFTLNPNLSFRDTMVVDIADSYTLSEDYRCAFKHYGNRKARIGAAIQNMRCPFNKQIEVVPDVIEGLDNQLLVKTGLIFNITMKRFGLCSPSDVDKLINSRLPAPTAKCLINLHQCILNSFKKIDVEIPEDDTTEVVIETFDMHGITPTDFINTDSYTTAEDLTSHDVAFVFEDGEVEQAGALVQFHNLTLALCMIKTRHYSTEDVLNIISLIYNDPVLLRYLLKDVKSNISEIEPRYKDLIEASNYIEIDSDLYCLIIGMRLSSRSFWNDLKVKDIMNKDLSNVTNIAQLQYIANKIISFIKQEIYEDAGDRNRDEVLELLKD